MKHDVRSCKFEYFHRARGGGWGGDGGKAGGLKLGYTVLAYYFVLVQFCVIIYNFEGKLSSFSTLSVRKTVYK